MHAVAGVGPLEPKYLSSPANFGWPSPVCASQPGTAGKPAVPISYPRVPQSTLESPYRSLEYRRVPTAELVLAEYLPTYRRALVLVFRAVPIEPTLTAQAEHEWLHVHTEAS